MAIPVETLYGDYRYHSRLAARWAVFFDLLGIRFRYRPTRYTLTDLDKREWMPDFVLPDLERDRTDPDLPRQATMVVLDSAPTPYQIETAMHVSKCKPLENVYIFVGLPTLQGMQCFSHTGDTGDEKPFAVNFGQCQFCGSFYIGPCGGDKGATDCYYDHYPCIELCEFAKRFDIDSAFMDFITGGKGVPLPTKSPILNLARMAAQQATFSSKDSLAALESIKRSIALLRETRCFASPELVAFTHMHAQKLSLNEKCPRFDNSPSYVHIKHRRSGNSMPCPCTRCTNERESISKSGLEDMKAPPKLM